MRPDKVLRTLTHLMAGTALVEHRLAGVGILSLNGNGGGKRESDEGQTTKHCIPFREYDA